MEIIKTNSSQCLPSCFDTKIANHMLDSITVKNNNVVF